MKKLFTILLLIITTAGLSQETIIETTDVVINIQISLGADEVLLESDLFTTSYEVSDVVYMQWGDEDLSFGYMYFVESDVYEGFLVPLDRVWVVAYCWDGGEVHFNTSD